MAELLPPACRCASDRYHPGDTSVRSLTDFLGEWLKIEFEGISIRHFCKFFIFPKFTNLALMGQIKESGIVLYQLGENAIVIYD